MANEEKKAESAARQADRQTERQTDRSERVADKAARKGETGDGPQMEPNPTLDKNGNDVNAEGYVAPEDDATTSPA